MLIIDNKLSAVSNQDIINGTFIIPNNVEIIDNNTFINCTDLESINIPSTIKKIGNNAFMGCYNLKSIIIPCSVIDIGKECFSKCKSLEFVRIDATIEKLSNSIFNECTDLKDVYLSNSIKIFGDSSFSNCKSLSSIKLPKNLKLIGKGCFYNCLALTDILLPASIDCIESNCFCKSGIMRIAIPKNVTELSFGLFQDCRNLQDIKLHEHLKLLCDNVFNGCVSLKEINLPDSLMSIGNSAFSNCVNLKQIVIPKTIDVINSYTFSNCKKLQKIYILGNIKQIESCAFADCEDLLDFKFKDGINQIYNHAFSNCKSLTKILLPVSIKQIFGNSFNGCLNIKEIELPSSLTNATDVISNVIMYNDKVRVYIYDQFYGHNALANIRNIRTYEMLERIYVTLKQNNHIYNLNKEKIKEIYETNSKFKDIVDTMIFKSRMENSNYEKELIKFDKLFPKTRFSNLPNGIIYDSLDDDLISKYNVKMMRKITTLDIFNSYNLECDHLVSSIISFFGLFENDKNCYHRFEILKKVLFYKYFFNNSEYVNMPNDIKIYFTKVPSKCFLLDEGINIPMDFKDYLKRVMNDDDVKNIKKLKNRFGKIVNDFFKNHYSLSDNEIYILNNDISSEEIKTINNYILNSTLNNQITYNNLNEIFKDIPRKYNENVLNFFLQNINTIVSRSDYRLKFKEIVDRYDEIKNYYLAMGNDNFSYPEAYRYLCESVFLNINKGNFEFEKMVKKAGVTSQSKFEQYQELYESIKDENTSIIPRVKETINIMIDDKEYTIMGEILRKDDPFALLVGELSYTNCCQRLNDNGYDCLVHAINDGRIFCTYLIEDNNKILLSQSWMWRNGNTICFDNIEGTNFMKKDIVYSKLVANAYKIISNKIVEMANKYKDKIDVVMVGSGHDDLKVLNEYFGIEYANTIGPNSYYSYLDSSRVHYIIGMKDQIDTKYIPQKLYIDERIFINEIGINITTKTIQKLGKINSKYACINFAYELSEILETSIYDISILYGEDWYILYKVIDNNLNIIDSGMLELETKKELKAQEKEILRAYELLIKEYNVSPDIIDCSNNNEKKYKYNNMDGSIV